MVQRLWVLTAVAAAAGLVAAAPPEPHAHGSSSAVPIPDRLSQLLASMSPEELTAETFLRYPCSSGPCVGDALAGDLNQTGVGSVSIRCVTDTSGAGSSPLNALNIRNAVQSQLVQHSRLHIPTSFEEEGLHSGAWGGTLFPGAVGIGATWDVPLMKDIGAAIALEARAAGVDTVYAPEVNMFDPRSGRYAEGISEDPMLTAALGAAMVLGLQGPRPQSTSPGVKGTEGEGGGCRGISCTYLASPNNVIALGKHYAQYGADGGGLNGAPTEISNRTLFEIYLKPWRALATAGMRGVMVAHSTTLHIPNHANVWLIDHVLREALGFGDGVVLTDDNNIINLVHWGVANNITHAAGRAMAATVDLDLQGGTDSTQHGYAYLDDAVAAGFVTRDQIKAAAARVLAAKFAAGLFDQPTVTPLSGLAVLRSPEHQALACRAAEEGIVLVTNTDNALPIPALGRAFTSTRCKNAGARPSGTAQKGKERAGLKVVVIGELSSCEWFNPHHAASEHHRHGGPAGNLRDPMPTAHACPARAAMLGPYTLYNDSASTVPTVAEVLATRVTPESLAVVRGGGPDETTPGNATEIAAAAAAAVKADLTLLVLGDSMTTAREGADRDTLDLAGSQLPLLTAVATAVREANVEDLTVTGVAGTRKLVVVLLPGRPTTFGWLNRVISPGNGVDAMLVGWRPGECGAEAIANVLSGSVNPSGKLSQAWPRSVGGIGGSASPWLARRPGGFIHVRDDVHHDPSCDAAGHCFSRYVDQTAAPLFPFGHGLSYTHYEYSGISATSVVPTDGSGVQCGPATSIVTVKLTVHNTGGAPGTEIVQVYAHDPLGQSLVVRLWKRLVTFGRVGPIPVGGSMDAVLNVSADDLATFDAAMRLRVEAGVFAITVGNSSAFDLQGVNVTVTPAAAAAATDCLRNAYKL